MIQVYYLRLSNFAAYFGDYVKTGDSSCWTVEFTAISNFLL